MVVNGLWFKMTSLLPLNFNGSVWHQAVFQYLLHKSLRVFTEPLSLTECFGFMLLTSAEASVEWTVSLMPKNTGRHLGQGQTDEILKCLALAVSLRRWVIILAPSLSVSNHLQRILVLFFNSIWCLNLNFLSSSSRVLFISESV